MDAKNPKLYREMSEPFANAVLANESLTKFSDELYELRKKHKIADVYVIAHVNVLDDEGQEGTRGTTLMIGDSLKALPMVAMAYGEEQERNISMLTQLSKRRSK